MLGPDSRATLVWALLLDWLGQLLILVLIVWIPPLLNSLETRDTSLNSPLLALKGYSHPYDFRVAVLFL